MKSWIRIIISISFSFTLMTTSVYAEAETEWQGGMTGGPGMMYGGYGGCMMGTGPGNRHHGMMHGRGPRAGGMGINAMQAQLSTLEDQLKLTDQQQAKWNEFKKVVEHQANSMAEHHQHMLEYFKNNQSLSLPQRIERHTQMMGERYASMTSYSTALIDLYQSMDPEQQKIIDQNMFMGCF